MLSSFPASLYTESAGEGGAMGDEDEGFDEEFCDTEDPPLRPILDLPPLNLQDLNNPDIQTLLAGSSFDDSVATVPPFPTTSLLDDIDPGVSMLEAEHSMHSLLEPEQGKLMSPLHSPFPISTPSPACASMGVGDVGVLGLSSVDDWNSYHMYDGHFPSTGADGAEFSSAVNACGSALYLLPPTSPSLASPSPPPHSSSQCFGLDMLTSLYNQSPVSDPNHTLSAHSPSPVPSYQNHHPASYSCSVASSPSPSLPPATPPPHDTSPHHFATSSSHYQYHSNYEYNPLPNGQSHMAKGCMGGAGCGPGGVGCGPSTHVTTANTNFTSCATQTPIRTPSPSPSSPAYSNHTHSSPAYSNHPHSSHTPSPSLATSSTNDGSSDDVPKSKPEAPTDKIVHMPFYQFKQILDSTSIPDQKKDNIKTVRRRGKNKIAAKVCRQRKMDLVMGLQQEIESLRAQKIKITGKTDALVREIELLKNRCAATYHHHRQRTCH